MYIYRASKLIGDIIQFTNTIHLHLFCQRLCTSLSQRLCTPEPANVFVRPVASVFVRPILPASLYARTSQRLCTSRCPCLCTPVVSLAHVFVRPLPHLPLSLYNCSTHLPLSLYDRSTLFSSISSSFNLLYNQH